MIDLTGQYQAGDEIQCHGGHTVRVSTVYREFLNGTVISDH